MRAAAYLIALAALSGPVGRAAAQAPPDTFTPPPDAPVAPSDPPLDIAAPSPPPPLPPRAPGEQAGTDRPMLSFGTDLYFIKPIVAIAGGIQGEKFLESANPNKEDRVTTVAITRFGFEGRLGRYVSFRSEFERNIGRHGTGIWEGTASFSVRDQFIRLQRWGFTLDGGIIFDEASLDFFSAHTADLLLADRYTRDPLLYSGFNRGQGLRVAYERWGVRLGLAYTEGNPLSVSTSFQVGGAFAGSSRFWERPLGNFRVGQPDDDLQFRVLSPSLTYKNHVIEVKTLAQVFWINYQATSKDDPTLFGYTLKGNVRLNFPFGSRRPMSISPFGNVAYVRNDALNNTSGYANQILQTPFWAITTGGGVDFFFLGRSGIGASYMVVMDESPGFVAPMGMTPAREPITATQQHYINGGVTYWLTDYVAAAARVASYRRVQDNQPDELDLSVFATLRLVI